MEMETKNPMPTKTKPLEINGRAMEIHGTGIQDKNGTPLRRGMMMAYMKVYPSPKGGTKTTVKKDLIQDLNKGISRMTKMEMTTKAEATKNKGVQTTHSTPSTDLIMLTLKNGRYRLMKQSRITPKMMKVQPSPKTMSTISKRDTICTIQKMIMLSRS